ncbi:oxidoreductase [Jannaschia donghaensis]|uniref:Sorbitol dehydrogenase n=1 Tax=Jannaschia donghaensis TaxID=420998 RepID=A0A0M6YMN2_9RHOB|nr:oxidoreductase [Jannaschia donghaensis]CTQ50517.1 Sorbitol dehydrogenase [Jannaschia donghaensis]
MADDTKVWFITGASRGMGLEIAKAALAAGDRVVATGRDVGTVEAALPKGDDVLALALDVTDAGRAEVAVGEAVERFGRIDVLVNNAGYGQLGVFEEIEAKTIARQFDTNVHGLMHVTRAVLPVMRAQKGGHVFNISSVGGALGFDIAGIYCATKFAVEGFSECLALEVKPFGIGVTIVEPGFFRTDFLHDSSIRFSDKQIPDYAEYGAATKSFYGSQNQVQAGDPARLGTALVRISREAEPPLRLAMGSDAVQFLGQAYEARQAELARWTDLSRSTDFEAETAAE